MLLKEDSLTKIVVSIALNHKKAPLCKGSCREATEGLLYYHYAGTINRQNYINNPSLHILIFLPFCKKKYNGDHTRKDFSRSNSPPNAVNIQEKRQYENRSCLKYQCS